MKIIDLEKQIISNIGKSLLEVLNNYYPDLDEISDAICVHKWEYSLPVDIYLDCNKEYQLYKHPLCIFFRNGYNEENDYLPIYLNNDINRNYKLNIYREDYFKVILFVRKFKKQIADLANEKISYREFAHYIHKNIRNGLLENEIYALNEFAILRPNESGLSRKLWIDTNGAYKNSGHNKRIKIEDPKGSKDPRDYYPLPIPDFDKIKNKKDLNIGNAEMEKIKQFVKKNMRLLLDLADSKISYEYFLANMCYFDRNGNLIEPEKENEYKEYRDGNFGFMIVINKDHLFNYIKNGNLLSKDWFKIAEPFKSNGEAFVVKGEQSFHININGEIKNCN